MKNALRPLALAPLMVAAGALIAPAQAAPAPETITYKRVGPLEIKADVYAVPGATDSRPVLVWIHGGALINGGREINTTNGTGAWLWRLHEQHRIVLVSIDYRLAPETSLPAIIEDVED